jgi:transcriptional regulator with XRE-family HTH domain
MLLSDGERRRRLGREIRRRREQAGLMQHHVSDKLKRAQTTISAWERGARLPNTDDLDRLDAVLSTGGALRELCQTLQQDSGGYASWFRNYVAVEAESSEIREYQPLTIPGLLQDPEYSRAQIQIGRPEDTRDEIEEGVLGRKERQKLLHAERGPLISAIVEEHVLRRPIGGSETLRKQLDHLLKVAQMPRVTFQAVSMDSEVHFGMDGAFILLRVPGRGHIAYRETRVDSSPREDAEAVEEYMKLYATLSAYALTPGQTCQLIQKIRSELND